MPVVPTVVTGLQEAICTHIKCVRPFASRTGDGPGLGAEGLAEENAEVADSTAICNTQLVDGHQLLRDWICDVLHPENADFLSWPSTITDEGRIGGQTRAEHRRSTLGFQGVRNREGEVLVSTNVRRVASLRQSAIGVETAVSIYHIVVSAVNVGLE